MSAQPDNLSSDAVEDDPERKGPLYEIPELRRVEAILFLAREPLSSRKIAELGGLTDGTEARSLVRQLNRDYDKQGRSFNVQQVAGGFQLRTRPAFDRWLGVHSRTAGELRLSSPALETLAVVAYRQPILKADIEAIRGVGCGELLRQLLDRGIVRITGRSPELGNPYLYGTTRRFLELFGLASLDRLPRGETLRGSGMPSMETPSNAESAESADSGGPQHEPRPLDEPPSSLQNPDSE